MKKIFLLFVLWCCVGQSFALTPKETKWVKTLTSITIESLSPGWFSAYPDIDKAPENISYWTNILPYSEDKSEDMYIVLPTLGLISPVVPIPADSQDYKDMANGKEIDINKYLVEGVIFYPKTWKIGQIWNPVIFGHSNFYKIGKGKYKTIFADIMNLDVGQDDEMWVYVKGANANAKVGDDDDYDLYKYRIMESYETNPENVGILKPKGGKELTVFACTDGLNGRWILRGKLIEPWEMLILNAMRKRMDTIVWKLQKMPVQKKQAIITKIVEKTQTMKNSMPQQKNYAMKYRAYVLEYFEKRLIDVY